MIRWAITGPTPIILSNSLKPAVLIFILLDCGEKVGVGVDVGNNVETGVSAGDGLTNGWDD